MARVLGAKTIIGTVGHEAKIPVALEAGADHVLRYTDGGFAEKVNELTNDQKVNIILDSSYNFV